MSTECEKSRIKKNLTREERYALWEKENPKQAKKDRKRYENSNFSFLELYKKEKACREEQANNKVNSHCTEGFDEILQMN